MYMACYGTRHNWTFYWIMIGFEIHFTSVIMLKFITDFKQEGDTVPTREFLLVAKNYLNNGFLGDILPWLPI